MGTQQTMKINMRKTAALWMVLSACLAAPTLAEPAAAPPIAAPLPAWCLGPFVRETSVNPIITPRADTTFLDPMTNATIKWEGDHTFNPAATVYQGRTYLLYRAEDDSGAGGIGSHTSRIGLASSTDGLHFTRRPTPVLYPANDDQKANDWTGGCEDPRCVEAEDGTYVLTYTSWNHAIARLSVATSPDLIHWTKHGPVFADADGGKFRDTYCKSGAILTRPGHHLVAAKVNGKYWMYWGEGTVSLATSSDLIHWDPVLDANGKIQGLLKTRPGRFDSALAEGGPPAVLLPQGIVVLYNGKNAGGDKGDPNVSPGAYSDGEALFDPKDPARLEDRLDHPFLQPQAAFESTGQYAAGTVFIEGLTHFHNHWHLYYGTADSYVATATSEK